MPPTKRNNAPRLRRGGAPSKPPPEVMIWGRAIPVLIIAIAFDSFRFMFTWFIFFAPALAGVACTIGVNSALGTSVSGGTAGQMVGGACVAVAAVAGFFGAGIAEAFGLVMAMVTGLAGWLVILLILLMFNGRIFKVNALWFGASLALSATPFLGSLPFFTGTLWKMYRTQIRVEKAAYKKWEQENTARLRQERDQQALEQSLFLQQQQAEQQAVFDNEWQSQMSQQEASGDSDVEATEASEPQTHIQLQSVPSQFLERARTTPLPQLMVVPNYTGETKTPKVIRTPTEAWLKGRYEDPFRQTRAKQLRSERNRGVTSVGTQGSESRQYIQNTARQLDAGDLDINKLATKHNALVVHTIPLEGWTKVSPKERIATVAEKRPDLSASIISADTVQNQDLLYPLGLVLDGKIISAYETDSATHAAGDSRVRPEQNSGTLQADPAGQFGRIAQSKTPSGSTFTHNESIVHMPEIKAILLDEKKLLDYQGLGTDEITETFPADEEEGVLRRYGDTIVASGKGTPTSGPYAGQQVFRIKRRPSELQKALAFAESNYPDLPVYVRKTDGIYSLDGEKVTAAQIYSTPESAEEIPAEVRRAA